MDSLIFNLPAIMGKKLYVRSHLQVIIRSSEARIEDVAVGCRLERRLRTVDCPDSFEMLNDCVAENYSRLSQRTSLRFTEVVGGIFGIGPELILSDTFRNLDGNQVPSR